ncbi:arginine transporter [Yoonia sp. GPGPB17]|uniref:arginine transporter n=1 Tax=Yoonia sp. GPGPB17 TaxID=3026147 RepID=UPI0030C21DE1
MRYFLLAGALASVAACGGGSGGGGATGDISRACLEADRRAASPALCSCVQQVANQSLSGRDQARAVTFFEDPQLAQDTRQSDRSADERFWDRYRAFTDLASEICRPVDA